MIKDSMDKINLTKQQKDALFLRISESCAASKKKPMKKAIIQYGAIAASVPLIVGGVALAMLFAAPGTLGGPIDVTPISSNQSNQETSGESADSSADASGITVPVTELKTLEELDLPDVTETYFNAQKEYARIADAECDGYTFILVGKVAIRNKDLYTVSDAKVYMLKDGEVIGEPLDAPSDGSPFMYFNRNNPSDTIKAFSMSELGNDKSPVLAVALSPDGSNQYCSFYGVLNGELCRIETGNNYIIYYVCPSKLEAADFNTIVDTEMRTEYTIDLENMSISVLTVNEAEASAEYVRFANAVDVDISEVKFFTNSGLKSLENKAMCLSAKDDTPAAVAVGDTTADGKATVTEAHCLFDGTVETDSEGRKYIDVPGAVIKPWENYVRVEGEITLDGIYCVCEEMYNLHEPGEILFFPYKDSLTDTLGFLPIKCEGIDRDTKPTDINELWEICPHPIKVGTVDDNNDIKLSEDSLFTSATVTFTSLEFLARENASGDGSATGTIKIKPEATEAASVTLKLSGTEAQINRGLLYIIKVDDSFANGTGTMELSERELSTQPSFSTESDGIKIFNSLEYGYYVITDVVFSPTCEDGFPLIKIDSSSQGSVINVDLGKADIAADRIKCVPCVPDDTDLYTDTQRELAAQTVTYNGYEYLPVDCDYVIECKSQEISREKSGEYLVYLYQLKTGVDNYGITRRICVNGRVFTGDEFNDYFIFKQVKIISSGSKDYGKLCVRKDLIPDGQCEIIVSDNDLSNRSDVSSKDMNFTLTDSAGKPAANKTVLFYYLDDIDLYKLSGATKDESYVFEKYNKRYELLNTDENGKVYYACDYEVWFHTGYVAVEYYDENTEPSDTLDVYLLTADNKPVEYQFSIKTN